jgi:hypothetical protein
MAEKAKLVDPVADYQEQQEQDEQAEQVKALSIEALSLDDFQPVPITAARQPHPFEGYPQKKMKIGTHKVKGKETDLIVSATHIVALNPKQYVHQDPSGKGVTIVSGGKEKIVDLATFHNRIVRDQNGRNIDVSFGIDIMLSNGRMMTRCAYCPDHTARAQIIFKVNRKTGKIEVDDRYVLADLEQVGRLRRLFEMFFFQQTQSERLAQKFDAEPESQAG